MVSGRVQRDLRPYRKNPRARRHEAYFRASTLTGTDARTAGLSATRSSVDALLSATTGTEVVKSPAGSSVGCPASDYEAADFMRFSGLMRMRVDDGGCVAGASTGPGISNI